MKKKLSIILLLISISSNLNAGLLEERIEACKAGKAFECLLVADMYAKGKEVKKNSIKTGEYLWRACEGGAAVGCYNLGNMYARAKSMVYAKQFFKKACDGGIENGCYNYKVLNKKE